MLFIKQRNQDGIDPNRFTLSGCTRHQQVRHGGQVNNKILIVDLLSNRNREIECVILKFIRSQQTAHTHHRFPDIGHFNTNGSLTGNGRDNPYPKRGEAQRDIIFQVFDPGNTDARSRYDFIQGYRGPDRSTDLLDFNRIIPEGGNDLVFMILQFTGILYDFFAPMIFQQVQGGIFIIAQIQRRFIRRQVLHCCDFFLGCLFRNRFNFEFKFLIPFF